jgi:hypothetical protein
MMVFPFLSGTPELPLSRAAGSSRSSGLVSAILLNPVMSGTGTVCGRVNLGSLGLLSSAASNLFAMAASKRARMEVLTLFIGFIFVLLSISRILKFVRLHSSYRTTWRFVASVRIFQAGRTD